MEIKRSKIKPSKSRIEVWEIQPVIEGDPNGIILLLKDIVLKVLKKTPHLIGYTAESSASKRFKGYENDGARMIIRKILLIYHTNNLADATEVEALLIEKFKLFPNNRNLRREQRRDGEDNNASYYVYLACEKLEANYFAE